MRTSTFRSAGVALLVFILVLAGCGEDGLSFGSASYTDMTDPSRGTGVSTPTPTDAEWRATVAAFESAQTAVYERGYRDGREVNCDLFERFNRGEISQTYGEREVERIYRERAGAYRSRTLAAEYTAGWKEGADSLAAVLFGAQSC